MSFNGVQSYAELVRATAAGGETSLSVANLPNKKWLIVLCYKIAQGGTFSPALRINNDSGSNYAVRIQENGSADTTAINQTDFTWGSGSFATPDFSVTWIENASSTKTIAKYINDTMSMTENSVMTKDKPQLEFMNFTDTIAKTITKIVAVSDSIVFSELITIYKGALLLEQTRNVKPISINDSSAEGTLVSI